VQCQPDRGLQTDNVTAMYSRCFVAKATLPLLCGGELDQQTLWLNMQDQYYCMVIVCLYIFSISHSCCFCKLVMNSLLFLCVVLVKNIGRSLFY